MITSTVKGRIGRRKEMQPTEMKRKDGSFFRYFGMHVEDTTKKKVKNPDGVWRYPTMDVRVHLKNRKGIEKLFQYLAPGRRVLAIGEHTDDPKVWTDKEGNNRAFPNHIIKADKVVFLDGPPMSQSKRDLKLGLEKGIISQEQYDTLMGTLEEHYSPDLENSGPKESGEEETPF